MDLKIELPIQQPFGECVLSTYMNEFICDSHFIENMENILERNPQGQRLFIIAMLSKGK